VAATLWGGLGPADAIRRGREHWAERSPTEAGRALRAGDRAVNPTPGVREAPSRNHRAKEHTAQVEWLRRLRRRSHRQVLADVLVLLGLAAFVLLVYVVVVLGGDALTGDSSSPDVALSVLATALVALAFDPVQTRLEQVVARSVGTDQASPYDVLRAFSATATGTYPSEELPERMVRLLADGTGARWTQGWLVVGGRPHLSATWPPGAARLAPSFDSAIEPGVASVSYDDEGTALRTLPVRHGGDLLGVLVVQERKDRPLSTVEERLFAGLAEQAGPVLHGARLRAELGKRLKELSTRAEELRTSRLRLVEAQDAESRLLERDIHDGAQQHLVALAVNLRLADTLAGRSRERADALLAEQESAASEALAVLVALSRGIYPAALGADGLVAALEAAVSTSAIPVDVVAVEVGRYNGAVEATAYFSCLEAVQNAAKHSGATAIRVILDGHDAMLTFLVEDDGVGFDPATTPVGTGLSNLRDRIESAGGTLTTETTPGGGTRIRAALPALPVPAPVVLTGGGS
jgi:signal transduction histidine kinase